MLAGTPENAQEFEQQILEAPGPAVQVILHLLPESGKPLFEGRSFKLCFDDGKLTSKHAY